MSKYTTEVRYICETSAGLFDSVGGDDVDEIIEKSRSKIFKKYPIFDEKYRGVLETKILEHYYTREIAFETVGLWKLKINTKLREIMPLYNQIYKSELLEFNPFYDTDITTNHDGRNAGTKASVGQNIKDYNKKDTGTVDNSETDINTGTIKNTGSVTDRGTVRDDNVIINNLNDTSNIVSEKIVTNKDSKKDAYSDTPQGSLANVEKNAYLTNYRDINNQTDDNEKIKKTDTLNKTGTVKNDNTKTNNLISENDLEQENDLVNVKDGTVTNNLNTNITDINDTTNTDTINNTEKYLELVTGKRGITSYSEMLLKFRDTFLNIDMLVIDELSDLFFGLW